jgi:hypothetical protein
MSVSAAGGNYACAGGIAGYTFHNEISRCYATGAVSASWSTTTAPVSGTVTGAGGIVGVQYAVSAASTARYNAALNPSVTAAGLGASGRIGRVAGYTSAGTANPQLDLNAAYDGMAVNGSVIPSSDPDAVYTGRHGLGKTVSEMSSQSLYEDGLSWDVGGTYWKWGESSGKPEIDVDYYTVTFDQNGGYGIPPYTVSAIAGTQFQIPALYNLTDALFRRVKGWSAAPNGTGTFYTTHTSGANVTINAPLTLYAVYENSPLTGIEVFVLPSKLNYRAGDLPDLSGLVIKAYYTGDYVFVSYDSAPSKFSTRAVELTSTSTTGFNVYYTDGVEKYATVSPITVSPLYAALNAAYSLSGVTWKVGDAAGGYVTHGNLRPDKNIEASMSARSSTKTNAVFALALYRDGKLIGADFNPGAINASYSAFTAGLPIPSDLNGVTAKIMVWDGEETLKPVITGIIVE